MIATIAVIAGKNVQQWLRSYGNHTSAIVAITANVLTTIAEIDFSSIGWFPHNPYDRSDRSDHIETSLEGAFTREGLFSGGGGVGGLIIGILRYLSTWSPTICLHYMLVKVTASRVAVCFVIYFPCVHDSY